MKRQANSRTERARPKRLTRRERTLFAGVASGLTITEAAVRAGYTTKCPAQAGSQALKNIAAKLPDLFERHGLSDDDFVEKHLLPTMNATEVRVLLHRGKIRYSKPLIAWGPRVQMISLIVKMKGTVKEEQENSAPSFKVVVINAAHRPERPAVSITIPRFPGIAAPEEHNQLIDKY
jgi:hypothetical protein